MNGYDLTVQIANECVCTLYGSRDINDYFNIWDVTYNIDGIGYWGGRMRKKYDFNNTFQSIVKYSIETIAPLVNIFYVVRNVYSRYSLYLDFKPGTNQEDFRNDIAKQDFSYWIDSIEDLSDDSFLRDELEKTAIKIDDKIFLSERRIEKTNWFTEKKLTMDNIISFYSFKGGLGRTTAMVLTAIELARRGKKIALLDFDLEAPGLATFFSDNDIDYSSVKGILDFIIDLSANKKNRDDLYIEDYYFSITDQSLIGPNGGELIVIPASATDENAADDYITKLSKADLTVNDFKDYLPDLLIKKIQDKIVPDYIFIDSQTGINDIGGMVLNRYSSKSFIFLFGNQQNMFGLSAIINRIKKSDYQFFLVNSPVPEQETDKKEEIEYFITNSYDILCNYYYQEDKIPDLNDELAEHYPINVPFSKTAINLNSYSKIKTLLSENGHANPYIQMVNIIDIA